jgi:hypothetical protein
MQPIHALRERGSVATVRRMLLLVATALKYGLFPGANWVTVPFFRT